MTGKPLDGPWSTESWRSRGGSSWLAQADRLEAMLEPVLEPLFQHADLDPGDRVLDVGCGRGATTRRAAQIVGVHGAVTAVDVSAELIFEAGVSPSADRVDGAGPIEWVVGDAQEVVFGDVSFDAVISRFGVMFFNDPVEAFTNLRGATRTGGRLAMATWRPRDACDFQAVGWQAISRALVAQGYDVAEVDPTAGPYAFGVDEVVGSVLDNSGWSDVGLNQVDLTLYYGGPGASPAEAVETAMGMAGLQTFLALYDDRAAGIAADALLDAFGRHHDGAGVRLDASILITTAMA